MVDAGVVHVPKPDWHPELQYSTVLPQKPADEQQSPNVEPWQVYPEVPPHVASGLTVKPVGVWLGVGARQEEGVTVTVAVVTWA